MRQSRSDVVIVGGGPAGSSTAIALAREGKSVTVVEAAARRGLRIGETVPPEVRTYLAALGAWEAFDRDAPLPSAGACSAWGEDGLAYRDAFAHPLGGGWHLDRGRFDRTLADEARRSGAEFQLGARVDGVERAEDGTWDLRLRDAGGGQRRLSASFLVDATGRPARVARRCGARRLHCDRLVAVFADFEWPPDTAAGRHTLVEAAELGWWYAARLPGDRGVVAFFSDGDIVHRHALSRFSPWCRLLGRTRHLTDFIGGPPSPRRLGIAPAASHCLDRPGGERWLAVGDAASAQDPLSSAGVVLALRSGIEAAAAIVRDLGGDPGAPDRYRRQVKARFTRYLLEWRAYYTLEGRWPGSEFWRRRQCGPLH